MTFLFPYQQLAKVDKEVVQLIAVNEGFSVAREPGFDFGMSQEVAEVDVEELARVVVEHVVARMAVSNSKHVRSHALAGEGFQKRPVILLEAFFDGLFLRRFRELLLNCNFLEEKVHHRLFGKRTLPVAFFDMHISKHGCAIDEFNVSRLKAALHDLVADHLHIHAVLVPQVVHDLEKLKRQVVLTQVITAFEQKLQLLLLLLEQILVFCIRFRDHLDLTFIHSSP